MQIQTVLDACKSIHPSDYPQLVNRKLIAVATEYCKHHQYSDQLILVIAVSGMKPLLYSHSYNFSILDLHSKVQSRLNVAKRGFKADIYVLEWLTLKQTAIPYYALFNPQAHKSNETPRLF